MNFAQAKALNVTPSATLVLPPNVFASEWPMRPNEPVCVGLRLLSEDDRRKARKVAEDQASELHSTSDNWIECFNDAVKRQVAALAMCDPNDVTKPSSLFPYAEDQVLGALTVSGTQYIFDAVEQHEIDMSPLEQAATQATLSRLAALLPLVDFATLSGRLSRRISCMLEEIESLVGHELVETGAVDDARDELPIVVGAKRQVG